MPTLSLISPWRHYATKTSSALEVTTYLLCAITLIAAMFDNTLSMKLYNVTAILGLLALLLRGKPESYSVQYWLLPLAIFIIGALDVVWYSAFKFDHSPFRATYHSYLNTAKIFLFGAFLTLLAQTSRIRFKKELPLYILYSLSFFIAGYAYYGFVE
ncbi:hypothetical protein [Citrobacter sp. RHB20-C15]|uniref:hypothetical protein n=1 Tax=Citrobacter sp. RHB20-C15 TaxID=2742620 RepID=UPI0015E9D6D1|nr:hypothetical protein [Citrobacter sp. RHB20-C15]QMK81043.1 hypothetical protein HVX63_00785 [Citrobacter sp. RHB20-C15]